MVLTPEDVANKQFTSTRLKPGYDEREVDEFLEIVAAELHRLHQEIKGLRPSRPVTQDAASAAAARAVPSVVRSARSRESAQESLPPRRSSGGFQRIMRRLFGWE